MKLIPLSQGKFAQVDDEDYNYLMQWKWFYSRGYALRGIWRNENGKQSRIWMHRLIMHTPQELEVDHINGDGINNQKYNLRNCTREQNFRNAHKSKVNTSGFKGVTYESRLKINRWRAVIRINRKYFHLGHFFTSEEAAHVFDKAAFNAFGEFAYLNFPEEWINRDVRF
jgi:hypothetical protein